METALVSEAGAGARYRRFWRWHFFAAFLVIPFVLWQSTTGTAYLWSGWLMRQLHPALMQVTPVGAMQSLSVQLQAALTTGPRLPIQEIDTPENARQSTVVLYKQPNGLPASLFVDPYNGRVLGRLDGSSWLPGLTRALHGGWPLGHPGSWLLELGDGWAMVMIFTGLYLWWPRKRRWWRVLLPRTREGARVLWRDLHACVAVWASGFMLLLLISALPWTAFWGGQILKPIAGATGQTNPAGFSPGGASVAQLRAALPALDNAVMRARAAGVDGGLQIRLGSRPDSALWLRNQGNPPTDDRYLMANAVSGAIRIDLAGQQLPPLARLIADGIHLHQGDYGTFNRWGNTLLAASLVWLCITGIVSWWLRRPRGQLAVPARVPPPWPAAPRLALWLLALLMPLFGASVLLFWLLDRYWMRRRSPLVV